MCALTHQPKKPTEFMYRMHSGSNPALSAVVRNDFFEYRR
jgi:hypothetical protein